MHNRDDEREPLLTDAPAGSTPNGDNDPPEAALRCWHKLESQLTPLIGDAGFSALYGRALRLTQPHFSWLTAPVAGQPSRAALERLLLDLRAADPHSASQAQYVLLATFKRLMSTLIGEVLTNQILNSASIDESYGMNIQEKSK
ncbi:hypothetical protein ACFQUU_00625 [Herbaspirillum sp. GCM10030257]|uniref:hypothetical protein n=1 Tax=Herbaspirillum sp. GCM10030257 TaxID=3273393 RepID=UPI003611F22C